MSNPNIINLNLNKILVGGNNGSYHPNSDGQAISDGLDPRYGPYNVDDISSSEPENPDETYYENKENNQEGGFFPIPIGRPRVNPFDLQVMTTPLDPIRPFLRGTLPNPHKTTMQFPLVPIMPRIRNPLVTELRRLVNIIENSRSTDRERINRVRTRINMIIRRLSGDTRATRDEVREIATEISRQISELMARLRR